MTRIAIDARKIGDFGIGTYIRGLLRGLAELPGDEELVLLLPARLRGFVPSAERFRFEEFDVPLYSLREISALGKAARACGADLLHLPHYVVPSGEVPFTVTIHDLIHLHRTHLNPLKPLYARWMMRRAALRSLRIFTVSEAVRQQIAGRYPRAAEKIVVTPNGVDASFFQHGLPFPPALVSRGVADGRYLLFVGNDKPHKNLGTLVEAFRRAHRNLADLSLVVAGSAAQWAGEGITTLGFVDDDTLRALYQHALAVVQPSLEEGFGLPVAEAMASGAPVIASNIASLAEVAGDAAMLVSPRSVEEFENAITRLASDESLRARLGAAGESRAKTFAWRATAERTLAVWREELSGSR